jgi:(2Fe-2S) ferredoxin
MSEIKKSLYECHVFVCTNKRDNGKESCADKGSVELRDQLKAWAKEKYGRRVRINNSGCLDFCSKGIVTVIYPEGEWHMNLTTNSLEELKDAITQKMAT